MATSKKTTTSAPEKKKPATAKKAPAKAAAVAKPAKAAKPAPKTQPAPVEGARAPDFALEGTDGKTHRLADYRGRSVILYFYPKDDTPGCTREAIAFEAAAKAIAGKNAVVLGVSKDSLASHAKFQQKYGLKFVLLSDPDLSVHAAYGAYGEKMMYGQKTVGVIRSTYVIGPDGKIKKAFPKVKVDGHDAQVLASL
jgi:thioredoxin-dependent peroxiredoxin